MAFKTSAGEEKPKMSSKALIRQGWLRAVIGLILVYPVIDNAVYFLDLILQPFEISPGRLAIVANNLLFAAAAIYLIRKFVDRKSFISLGFSTRGYALDIMWGFIGSLILMGSGFLILLFLGRVEVISYNPDAVSILYWGAVLLLVAVMEELSFRGYLLSNMMESMNHYLAVGIISVVFGLGHASGQNVSFVGLINCMLMGVLAGLYYVHRRNLWGPIAFHTGWNFFQGTIFGFNVSGRSFNYSLLNTEISGNNLLSGGPNGFEGSLILSFLTVAAVFVLMRFFSKKRRSEVIEVSP